jgi:hypothetical protein
MTGVWLKILSKKQFQQILCGEGIKKLFLVFYTLGVKSIRFECEIAEIVTFHN